MMGGSNATEGAALKPVGPAWRVGNDVHAVQNPECLPRVRTDKKSGVAREACCRESSPVLQRFTRGSSYSIQTSSNEEIRANS